MFGCQVNSTFECANPTLLKKVVSVIHTVPRCAIFFKSMGFKDIKYDFPVYQMENTQIHTQVCKYTKTKCLKDPTCAIFLKSMGFKDIKYDILVYQM